MRLVLDNLHTHTGASVSAAFPPPEARRLLDRLAIHPTPQHARWLNLAEIARGVLHGPGLDRRMDNTDGLRSAMSAWEARRNKHQGTIHWRFPIAVARNKLKKLSLVVANSHRPM